MYRSAPLLPRDCMADGARLLLGGSASDQPVRTRQLRTPAFWESSRPDAFYRELDGTNVSAPARPFTRFAYPISSVELQAA
jgi:hypothetical protein